MEMEEIYWQQRGREVDSGGGCQYNFLSPGSEWKEKEETNLMH
jgi:hypothetical protein